MEEGWEGEGEGEDGGGEGEENGCGALVSFCGYGGEGEGG